MDEHIGREGERGARHQSLFEHSRQVRSEAQALAATIGEVADEVEDRLRVQLDQRLYTTLAIAAGAGYVLGGGLPSRLTKLIVGLGARAAAAALVSKLVAEAECD